MSVRSVRHSSLEFGRGKSRFASTDREATAFLEAAGIFASHEQKAIYELVRLLKQYGLWSKMKAIYPFVGGTATTHKWNLKDPQDTDAAYRLTFSGGWTHNENGITGNGTNTVANCNVLPTNIVVNESSHISIYNRTNNKGAYFDINSYVVGTVFAHYIFIGNASDVCDFLAYKSPDNSINGTNASKAAFYINSRTTTTSNKAYKNDAQFFTTNTTTAAGFTSLNANYCIGANAGGTTAFSNRNYAFASIGDGLTDTEAANLYWAVDKYQRLLSRNV